MKTNLLICLAALTLNVAVLCAADEPAAAPEPAIDAGNLRTFVELVRSDVKTEKALIIAQNIDFTSDEAVDFWPLYREYTVDLSKWYDRRLALIRTYLANGKMMTDEQTRKLADDVFTLEEKRTDLKRKYFKKFSKVAGVKKTARFFQIENQLNAAIDLRLAAALPLIK